MTPCVSLPYACPPLPRHDLTFCSGHIWRGMKRRASPPPGVDYVHYRLAFIMHESEAQATIIFPV